MHRLFRLAVIVMAGEAIASAASPHYAAVCQQARELAAGPFQASTNLVPEELNKLGYDQMRDIVFQRKKALWGEARLPFKIEFFHPGGLHHDIVTVHQIDGDKITIIPFSPGLFSYGSNHVDSSGIAGFAGFRILNRHKSQEVAAFLDASYFRMAGQGQSYGTSARGLALNTSQLGREEFPVFREFWLCKPHKYDREITLYALLDSRSVTGAFEFIIRGGESAIATVTATFFPRIEIREFGIAPLTSMFWYDEDSHQPLQDFRPAVHDADGLLLRTSRDEWIWRPFESGKMARFNVYADERPRGFGVLQRDRDFEHYADLVARYHERPSTWIEPVGNWGAGTVTLVQLPTENEFADNIVAYWVPDVAPKPGEPLVVSYKLECSTNKITPKTLGQVRSTRVGRVSSGKAANVRFVIEFEGGRLEHIPEHKLKAVVRVGREARETTHAVIQNDFNHTRRLVIEIAQPENAVDLMAFLQYRNEPVTETWNYTFQP